MTEHGDIIDFLDAAFPNDDENVVRMARGTITQADGGNFLVNVVLGGGAQEIVSVRYFDTYTPAIGDDVHVLRVGPDVMVLGKIKRP